MVPNLYVVEQVCCARCHAIISTQAVCRNGSGSLFAGQSKQYALRIVARSLCCLSGCPYDGRTRPAATAPPVWINPGKVIRRLCANTKRLSVLVSGAQQAFAHCRAEQVKLSLLWIRSVIGDFVARKLPHCVVQQCRPRFRRQAGNYVVQFIKTDHSALSSVAPSPEAVRVASRRARSSACCRPHTARSAGIVCPSHQPSSAT